MFFLFSGYLRIYHDYLDDQFHSHMGLSLDTLSSCTCPLRAYPLPYSSSPASSLPNTSAGTSSPGASHPVLTAPSAVIWGLSWAPCQSWALLWRSAWRLWSRRLPGRVSGPLVRSSSKRAWTEMREKGLLLSSADARCDDLPGLKPKGVERDACLKGIALARNLSRTLHL